MESDPRSVGEADLAEVRKAQLAAELKTQQGYRNNRLDAIKIGGNMQSLVSALAKVDAQIKRIDEMMSAFGMPAQVKDVKIDEIRKFVEDQAGSFEALLMGSAQARKIDFEHRFSKPLVVTPAETDKGRIFRVNGDVGLFSPDDGALLSGQVPPTGQQCTIHVNFRVPLYVPNGGLRLRSSFLGAYSQLPKDSHAQPLPSAIKARTAAEPYGDDALSRRRKEAGERGLETLLHPVSLYFIFRCRR